MVWLNTFAGDAAFQRAENLAKKHNGFSVNAESYRGIRPALAVYSDQKDLVINPFKWSDLIDNFLEIDKEFYEKEVLSTVNYRGYTFLVKAVFLDIVSWTLVVEKLCSDDVEDFVNSYGILTNFAQLDITTKELFKSKFKDFESMNLIP